MSPRKLYPWNGQQLCIDDIADAVGMSRRVLKNRVWAGEPIDTAVLPRARKKTLNYTCRGLPSQLYSYRGEMVTVRRMCEISGLKQKTIRMRIRLGWAIDAVVETPLDGRNEPSPRKGWRWRTSWLRPQAIEIARTAHERTYRDIGSVPLAYDPWAQAAIDVAAEDGGWSLDMVGLAMGGLSRERVRQIEDAAFRRIRRVLGKDANEELLSMLRSLDQTRKIQDPFALEERLETDMTARRNAALRREEAKRAQKRQQDKP